MIIHSPEQRRFFEEFLSSTEGLREDGIREKDGRVKIVLRFAKFGCFINFYIASQTNNGDGTRAMQWLKKLANEHNVPLYGLVSPIGYSGITDREKLKAWYLKLGFDDLEDGRVAYLPK